MSPGEAGIGAAILRRLACGLLLGIVMTPVPSAAAGQEAGTAAPVPEPRLDEVRRLNQEARGLAAAGRFSEAEPLVRQALEILERSLSPDHPMVALSLANLAMAYSIQGKRAEAEPLFLRALGIWEQRFGARHPVLVVPLNNLADLYRAQGRDAAAEPLYRRALAIAEATLGPEHETVGIILERLAGVLRRTAREPEATRMETRAALIRHRQVMPRR